jgi:hypothetical protein
MLLVILVTVAAGGVLAVSPAAADRPWLGALLVVASAPAGFAAALWAGTVWSPMAGGALLPGLLFLHEALAARRYRLPPDPGAIWLPLFFLASTAAGALVAYPYLKAGVRRRKT